MWGFTSPSRVVQHSRVRAYELLQQVNVLREVKIRFLSHLLEHEYNLNEATGCMYKPGNGGLYSDPGRWDRGSHISSLLAVVR